MKRHRVIACGVTGGASYPVRASVVDNADGNIIIVFSNPVNPPIVPEMACVDDGQIEDGSEVRSAVDSGTDDCQDAIEMWDL